MITATRTAVSLLQAPPVPDLSALQGLEPGVAYAVLAVVTLGMLLFYFGPGLRDRFRPPASATTPPPDTTPSSTTGAQAPPPALPAALDRADALSDRYIAHLEATITARDRVIADHERDLERLRVDLERLREQRQWRGSA